MPAVSGERIRDDLRGHFRGELRFDELARALYSTDASIFRIAPLGVAVPRDEADVRVLVRYASENHIPLTPRGAGTGLAGEALGAGLVIDFSTHFRSILGVEGGAVRVQPGVVYRRLNEVLARYGRRFAPDPASGATCTVGGMLATDASGARAFAHGFTRDHTLALRAVWDNGDAETVARPGLPGASGGEGAWESPRTRQIARGVAGLAEANRELIRACRPRTPFDRCGYRLHEALGGGEPDLPRLLVGSEGTLALFTEATLRTVPLPGGRAVILFGFAGLDDALQAAAVVRGARPAACELLDRRLLALTRLRSEELGRLIPAAAGAVLLVEFEADTPREARDRARGLIDELQLRLGLARLATPAFEPEAMERLWHAREAALPSLYALGDGQRPLAFVEDVGVPPEALAEFIPRAQDLLQGFETTASFLVHALTGQVHIRPFLDLDRPEDSAKLWPIAEALYGLVWEHGGTISAQHGTGLARTPWVGKQLGRLYPLLRELKAVFDPQGLFNPGKIVGPDPSLPAWPLRSAAAAAQPPGNGRVALPAAGLVWAPGEAAGEVARCNGCGDCRAEAPPARMCPMFRVTHAEDATPRAKANLLRHLLNGGAATPPSADEVRAVADLCINCRMCPRECPARVNVPKLMIEARAANLAEHGLARADWVLARTEHFAALGSAFAPVTNLLLRSRAVRWAVEKLFGVSRRRRLPPFALRSFLRRAKHRGWTRKPKPAPGRERVAYFVDVFPNYNDPAVAEAAVAVLLHNGVQVYVPPEQTGCGMAPLAQGDVETAREVATRNVRAFAELAREGFRIVCSEPTAALMLSHDYLDLLDDPDARLVAGQTAELTAYLAELHRAGRLRTDFAPLELTLGHHVPCHLKALGGEPQGPGLLALIPNLRVRTIDKSCSGMAGTFGLKMENYAASLEAGRPMLDEMRRPGVLFGSTECSACRVQMEEGSGKTTLHPVQYLALAYGLMPELAGRLFPPRRKPVGP